MNDNLDIPLLEDLIVKGQVDSIEEHEPQHHFDEHMDVEFEADEDESITPPVTPTQQNQTKTPRDELTEDANIQELIIDEEIRMILDKHMDKAYEEIIRLLNHKIS